MRVLLHPIPEKYLARLNEPDKSRLETALAGLEKEPLKGDIKPISGQPGTFRARIEPASKKETAMVNKRMKDYEKDPSSFIPLKSIK